MHHLPVLERICVVVVSPETDVLVFHVHHTSCSGDLHKSCGKSRDCDLSRHIPIHSIAANAFPAECHIAFPVCCLTCINACVHSSLESWHLGKTTNKSCRVVFVWLHYCYKCTSFNIERTNDVLETVR